MNVDTLQTIQFFRYLADFLMQPQLSNMFDQLRYQRKSVKSNIFCVVVRLAAVKMLLSITAAKTF